jgi:hypothetical protein
MSVERKDPLGLADFDLSDTLPTPVVEEDIDKEDGGEEDTPTEEPEVEPEVEPEEEPEVEPEIEPEPERQPGSDSDLDLKPLYEMVNRDMPVELEMEGYDTGDPESLAKFIKDAVAANSKPAFANEEVEKFNTYVAKGGNPRSYMDEVYGDWDYSSVKLEDNEGAQKQVLSQFLAERNPNRDSEWINNKIERYENSGVLELEAAEALEYLQDKQSVKDQELIAKQSNIKQEQELTYKKQLSDFKTQIEDQTKLAGVTMNDSKKKKLFEFATSVDKHGKTEYQKILESVPEAQLQMLMFAMNGFKAGPTKIEATTAAARELKKGLSRFKSSNIEGSGSSRATHQLSRTSIKDEFSTP